MFSLTCREAELHLEHPGFSDGDLVSLLGFSVLCHLVCGFAPFAGPPGALVAPCDRSGTVWVHPN